MRTFFSSLPAPPGHVCLSQNGMRGNPHCAVFVDLADGPIGRCRQERGELAAKERKGRKRREVSVSHCLLLLLRFSTVGSHGRVRSPEKLVSRSGEGEELAAKERKGHKRGKVLVSHCLLSPLRFLDGHEPRIAQRNADFCRKAPGFDDAHIGGVEAGRHCKEQEGYLTAKMPSAAKPGNQRWERRADAK
jgi:hypothetical protein